MTYKETKKDIITIANELILQGYELSELANNDKLINDQFRIMKLTIIIEVLKTIKEEWKKEYK